MHREKLQEKHPEWDAYKPRIGDKPVTVVPGKPGDGLGKYPQGAAEVKAAESAEIRAYEARTGLVF